MNRYVVYAPLFPDFGKNWYLRCMMDGDIPDWTYYWWSAGCWHEDEEEFIKIKEKVLPRSGFDCHIITEWELVQMHMLFENLLDEDRSEIKTTHLLEFLPTGDSLRLTEDEVIRAVQEMKPDISRSWLEERLKNEPKFEIDVVGLKLVITKKDDEEEAEEDKK